MRKERGYSLSHVGAIAVVAVLVAAMVASALIVRGAVAARDERRISLYEIHTKETLTVTYKRNGRYIPAALKKINWQMRDWRRNTATKIDPRLIDIMWELHRELGSRKPINIISGFRSRKTNDGMRKRGGGQARFSRHILGKAADIHFPDVPVKRIRASAMVRERGGVGYYPTSAIPFVHVDTGRIRHWPRMNRLQLAMLFPYGRTRHIPRDGRPLTKKDRYRARVQLAKLNSNTRSRTRVASLRKPVRRPRRTFRVASLDNNRLASRASRPSPPYRNNLWINLNPAPLTRPAEAPQVVAPATPVRVQKPEPAPAARMASLGDSRLSDPTLNKKADHNGQLWLNLNPSRSALPDTLPRRPRPILVDRPADEAQRAVVVADASGPVVPGVKASSPHRNKLWLNKKSVKYAALLPGPVTTASNVKTPNWSASERSKPEEFQKLALASPQKDQPAVRRKTKTSPAPIPRDLIAEWITSTMPADQTLAELEPENVAYAPAYDPEHPDELDYRPFAILPFLSARPVSHDRQMAALMPPEFDKITDFLGVPERIMPLEFRPRPAKAALMMSSQFTGKAVRNVIYR